MTVMVNKVMEKNNAEVKKVRKAYSKIEAVKQDD